MLSNSILKIGISDFWTSFLFILSSIWDKRCQLKWEFSCFIIVCYYNFRLLFFYWHTYGKISTFFYPFNIDFKRNKIVLACKRKLFNPHLLVQRAPLQVNICILRKLHNLLVYKLHINHWIILKNVKTKYIPTYKKVMEA